MMSNPAQTNPSVSPAQTDDFDSSVLLAARHQAELMLKKAQKESNTIEQSILGGLQVDTVSAYRTRCEANLRRSIAAEKQANRQKLLVYRRQLMNGLIAEVEEELIAFTQSTGYAAYLVKKVALHAVPGCTILVRPADMALQQMLAQHFPVATIAPDADIHVGGVKVVVGRILYDETMDDAIEAHREAFLTRCNLHVE